MLKTLMPVILIVVLLSFTRAFAGQEKPDAIHSGPADEIVVTAARVEQSITESASLVTVLPEERISATPFLVLDDLLRAVPGFSLLRRSSSLVAHPTTQGVSLRGIGPSGASRSLVLLDGIPLNDPVGGWVYWNRMPFAALSRVEVVRGATSQLYGSSALGGTIQLIPKKPSGCLSSQLPVGTYAPILKYTGFSSSPMNGTRM